MATADLAIMETCGLLSFSPLIDLRRAWTNRIILATVRADATEPRWGLERDMAAVPMGNRHGTSGKGWRSRSEMGGNSKRNGK